MMSVTVLFSLSKCNSSVNCCNKRLGNELLAGFEKVTVATVFSITVEIEPVAIIIFLS
jgi:hypothetical protein